MAVIGFKTAKCKDCFKCVRICPVKAIHTKDEHALYVASECVLCGKCVEACPQHAIVNCSDIKRVKQFMANGEKIVVSLDPSYLGIFGDTADGTGHLRDALYKLGFSHIHETAEGAAHVTKAYERLIRDGKMENIITSACPVINELVEKYYPDMIPYMAPVVSPMVAHGMMLKEKYGEDVKVVYIGSCTAKGREVLKANRDHMTVDAVLDFQELRHWLDEENIRLEDCEFRHREGVNPKVNGLYGVSSGILSSITADKGFGTYEKLYVDGIQQVKELFDCIRNGEIKQCFIEVSSCVGGCINGPLTGAKESNRFRARIYTNQKIIREFPDNLPKLKDEIVLRREFRESAVVPVMPTEAEIQEALRKEGKTTKEKQLNCGACGYKTCRDKAIAVCQNKNQMNLCIPYMYQQARSLAEMILSVSPNMIITVDEQLNIRQFNHAAESIFKISADEAHGMPLSRLINPENFEKVIRTKENILNKKIEYPEYNIVTKQSIMYIKEQDWAMAIFRDITADERIRQQHAKVRMEAIDIAQKVIDKQMMVAQEIAGLLGETTAETKVTLTHMRDSMFADGDDLL